MPLSKEARRQQSKSISNAREKDSPVALSLMLLFGMMISGMTERSVYPKSFSSSSSYSSDTFPGVSVPALGNVTTGRRYCDPPNVTVLTLYEIYYDSEEENSENDYDFAQMEEMDFQLELGPVEKEAQWRWLAFLLGSLIAPAPAAWLAVIFRPGRVFGFFLLCAGATGLVPSDGLAARVILSFFQGIMAGCLLPCALLLIISSASKEKRAVFLALLSGSRLGFAIGELIPENLRSFTSCILGVTWYATWVLMFNTERLVKMKHKVPWRKIMTSRVVWMSAIAVFGTELLQATTMYTLRQYLDVVYNFTNRYILALSFGLQFLFALLCSRVGETLESSKLVSKTSSRRIFVYISHFIPSGLLFVSGFVGCHQVAPVTLFALSTIIGGAAYAGAFASIMDVAPNFSGVVVALVCTCGALTRVIPVLQTFLIFDGLMPGSWRLALSINTLVALVTAIFFMLRGSSRPPSWNYPEIPPLGKRVSRLTLEGCILRVLAVQEADKFTRARACSVAGPTSRVLSLHRKRASIS